MISQKSISLKIIGQNILENKMSQSEPKTKKPLILMVDDVPKNLQVLGNILGANDYLITPAMSGEQALARVGQLMPDLILLDIMMPGIDGFETCRQIKANPKTKDIPVIFLTAKTETVDIVKGFNVGAVDYVTKPFQAEELITRVETQISLKQKTNELKTLYDELKQSEKKYKGLFDTSVDAIIRLSESFRIIDINPGAKTLLGLSSDPLPVFTDFLSIENQNQFNSIVEKQVNQIGYSDPFDSQLIQMSNTKIPVEMRLWRSSDEDTGLWILIRDISERKAMDQLREDVDRIMRHDLKNPLSGIIGLSDMLMMYDNFNNDQQSWIEQIRASGRQALEMIDHSLDIFKMEQGKYEFLPIPCNVVPLLKKTETNFYQLLTSKSLVLLFFIHDAPMNDQDIFTVFGEKRLLEGLIANLIKNAIEASPAKEKITITLKTDMDQHRLIIHNQGTIPVDLRDRFFEKYATSGKKTGTGLGTYSAMLIAKTHGGDIQFQSNEKEGTYLTVLFPRSSQDTFQQNVSPTQNQPSTRIPSFNRQLKILVADDSPNNMLMIGHYLEPFPCLLDLAENGQVCVDYFKTSQYDLVLIDLQMPVMDGFEAISKIRSFENENDCSPTPIIALSADNDEKARQTSIEMGCNEFMTKPISEKCVHDLIFCYCQCQSQR
jgi:PAS domain S-box-containing protein